MNIRPLQDRVIVKRVKEEEKTAGGIIIPDTAKEKPQEGIVRVLGTGKTGDDGKKIAFEVKVGDRVLVSKYGGTEIKLDGKEYKIFSSDDLLAIMARDKKSGGGLTFVLAGPSGIEKVEDPDLGAVRKALAAVGVET